jgi:photosystem II stability/assembly factor-like uncharacterized protein
MVMAVPLIKYTIVCGVLGAFAFIADAHWIKMDTVECAHITSFTVNGNSLFAGTSCGIFKSDDLGKTWLYINTGQQGNEIGSLTVCGNILYAATSCDIFRSVDTGKSWTDADISLPVPYENGHPTYLQKASENVMFTLFEGRPFRSIDKGFQWSAIAAGLPDSIIQLEMVHETVFALAGRDSGLFRSFDFGETWSAVASDLKPLHMRALKAGNNAIFVAVSSPESTFRSDDNGSTWIGVDYRGYPPGQGGEGDTTLPCVLLTDPQNTSIITIDSTIIIKNWVFIKYSTDNGTSWVNGSRNFNDFLVMGDTVFAGTDDGLYFTDKSVQHWTKVDSMPMLINSLAISNGAFYANTENGIYCSFDRTKSWIPLNQFRLPSDADNYCVASDDGIVYTTFQGGPHSPGSLLASPDNGETWTAVFFGLQWPSWDSDWHPFYSNDKKLFFAGGVYYSSADQMLLSMDKASKSFSWNLESSFPRQSIQSITMNNTTLIVGTDYGIFRSADGGTNWSHCLKSLHDFSVRDFAVNDNGILAATNVGILRSIDDGVNWTKSNSGLPGDCSINAFAKADNMIFAGTVRNGIFLSTNGGIEWNCVDSELTGQPILFLKFANEKLFASTSQTYDSVFFFWNYAHDLWYRPISEFTGGINAAIPKAPLNQTCFKVFTHHSAIDVAFGLSQPEQVSCRIYSMLGREVIALINKTLAPGSYHYRWNTRDLAPGNYLLRMQLGNRSYNRILPFVL